MHADFVMSFHGSMFAAPGARVLRRVVPIVLLVTLAGCAARRAVPPPATPLYPAFEFPGLETPLPGVTEDVMARHQDGWNLLQSGQPGAAARVFTSILEKTPAFYPAKAALGYTALAHRNYDAAIGAFDAVLAQAPKYLPALSGRADALLAANRPVEAIKALEALIAADPSRTAAKTQLESLRLGAIESLVAEARAASQAGNLEAARAAWQRAVDASPESAFMRRELAAVEKQSGRLDEALAHVKSALSLDPRDPATHVLLAEVEEARGNLQGALDAYRQAQQLDPRSVPQERITSVQRRIELAALPAPYRMIATAPVVTRGDLAALLGVKLQSWLAAAPPMAMPLLTDVREHWAQRWILEVLRAGVMRAFPNHTFQPAQTVRRGDLAHVISNALERAAERDPAVAGRLRSATPPLLSDLPPGHAVRPAAEQAVAAGVMTTEPGGAFVPSRPVSGAEASAAVDRLAALLTRP